MMEESQYHQLVDAAFRKIMDAFDEVDPDEAELDSVGDVLTVTYADGTKNVINTQRPTRQIWLAGRANAWHFSYDDASATWLDDKGSGDELFAMIIKLAKDTCNVDLPLA